MNLPAIARTRLIMASKHQREWYGIKYSGIWGIITPSSGMAVICREEISSSTFVNHVAILMV